MICKGCGKPLCRRNKIGLCIRCFNASHPHPGTLDPEASLNWASDPCKQCGKWPLHIRNKSGYCRKCSRSNHRHRLYPRPSRAGERKRKRESLANESRAG